MRRAHRSAGFRARCWSVRSRSNRHRPCARDAARRFGGGPGAPRPGARLSSFIRVDRGRAVASARPFALDPGQALTWVALSRTFTGLNDEEAARKSPARGRAPGGVAATRASSSASPRGPATSRRWPTWPDAEKHSAYKRALRRGAGRRPRRRRAPAVAWPRRGSDRGGPRPAGDRGDGEVLPQGVRGLPGRLRGASLPDPHVRGPRTHRRRARSRRRLLAARAGGPPRAPHVRPRPAAGRPRGRGDRRVPQDVRAGEGVLRGREHPRRPRLAPRAQPRPALDGLPAPGAHAAGRAAHARVARAAGPGGLPRVQPEGVAGLPPLARAERRGPGRGGRIWSAGSGRRRARSAMRWPATR